MRSYFLFIGSISTLFAIPLFAWQSKQNHTPSHNEQENQYPCYPLPSARPCIQEKCTARGFGGGFDISFLLWQACEDGLGFAIKNNPRLTPAGNLAADVNGSIKTIDFNWRPAVKINFEMKFSSSWDFDTRWTIYYSKSTSTYHAHTDIQTGSGLLSIWTVPQSYLATPTVYGKAQGTWLIHLNTVDLEFGYHPFLTPKLGLRLFLGLKGISVSQKFNVAYFDGIDDGSIMLMPSQAALRNRCLGLGPSFGIKSQWHLKHGWSLLADATTSMSLSVFSVKRHDEDNAISHNAGTYYSAISKFRESFYAYRPNFESRLGIGWEECYGKCKQYSLQLSAAYEIQYYYAQNMMRQLAAEPISFSPFSMQGDLHFHGITTTLQLGF